MAKSRTLSGNEEPFWWAAEVNSLVQKRRVTRAIKMLDRLMDANLDRNYVLTYKVRLLQRSGRVKEAIAWVCLESEVRSTDPVVLALKDEMLAKYQYSLFEARPSSNVLGTFRRDDSEWSDVAGMQEIKVQLHNDVILPVNHPERFRRFGIGLPNGILMYGPPGCGKTYLGRKLAERIGYNFSEIHASSVGSPYLHQTAIGIRDLFAEARNNRPSILFLDEIDSLAPKRESSGMAPYRVEEVNELLRQLDRCHERGIFVIAACNNLDRLDPALRRPGRFDKQIYVGPPDDAARHDLFRYFLKDKPHALGIDFEELVKRTEGYSNADIDQVVKEAASIAAREDAPQITWRHFKAALTSIPTSLPPPDKKPSRPIGFSGPQRK